MEQVGPAVPGDRRYELLMANNAIGIASRELEAGEGPGRAALERLEALYGESHADGDWRERHNELTIRFAADIRAGAFDEGPTRVEALAHVRQTTLDAVRVGKPPLPPAPRHRVARVPPGACARGIRSDA